ncbi:MAG: hypothetical protein NXI21_02680 [Alphaproteobacteria bacterium]|nr:hypothetical protein [Alphaproteobacteria bacterium]
MDEEPAAVSRQRMKQLRQAWALVSEASPEERKELFRDEYEYFNQIKQQLDEPENRFHPHSSSAFQAIDGLVLFYRRLTGYRAGWIPEKLLEHCCQNAGRQPKYDLDTRETNCIFISMMVERGASETQAMKLLMRLKGDNAMSSGHLRELQDTYRDFKRSGRPSPRDLSIKYTSHNIAEFLKFSISNLEGEDAASRKAVSAFRQFFQELIDVMKESHDVIAKRDRSYPEIFGCVIDWLNADYEDPLDYFFAHEPLSPAASNARRRALREYINTMYAFRENPIA